MGKMAAAIVTACLVLSILHAYEATKRPNSQVNRMVNGMVYLNPLHQVPENYQQIIWRFNDSLKILIKKPNNVTYPNDYFKNKLRYHENHTLEINQLQEKDSSTYLMDVEDSESKETRERFQLAVYRPVPKPSVKANVSDNEEGLCKATLVCTVNASKVTYQWCKDGKTFLDEQSTLDVQLKSESTATYECIVSNPVSQEIGIIYLRSQCKWTETNLAVSLSLARKTVDSIVAFGFLLLVHTWV